MNVKHILLNLAIFCCLLCLILAAEGNSKMEQQEATELEVPTGDSTNETNGFEETSDDEHEVDEEPGDQQKEEMAEQPTESDNDGMDTSSKDMTDSRSLSETVMKSEDSVKGSLKKIEKELEKETKKKSDSRVLDLGRPDKSLKKAVQKKVKALNLVIVAHKKEGKSADNLLKEKTELVNPKRSSKNLGRQKKVLIDSTVSPSAASVKSHATTKKGFHF
jgi:hypothetical protein